MTWFIWILISILATAVANLYQRVVMKEEDRDAYSTMVIFQFLCAGLTGVYALWQGFQIPPVGPMWWNVALSMFFWGFGSYFLFRAFQTLESSEIAIISSLSALVTIVTSILFLGEAFSLQKALGTALILASVIIVSVKNGKLSLKKGTNYAVLSAVLFGLGVTNDAFILRSYDAVSYTTVAFLLPGILFVIMKPRVLATMHRLREGSFLKNMLALSVSFSLQAVAYYIALQAGNNAAQIAPIYKSNIILTVFLAMLFLKEWDRIPLKIVSAILVTFGAILVL